MLSVRMKCLSRFFLLVLTALVSISGFAQDPSANHDPVYGYDALLYNGKIYYFTPGPKTSGTPFLSDEFDTRGSVTVRDVTYPGLNINYDIYNQQVILKYTDAIGSSKLIEISQAWLKSFVMNGSLYEFYLRADSTKRIYQVFGSGKYRVLYYQRKDLEIDNTSSSGRRYFSETQKESYVQINDQLHKYKNSGSFIKAFSKTQQDLIKTYIRRHNVDVRKANTFIMTDLINYCNTLAGL